MKKELHDHRKSYEKGILSQASVAEDPIVQFEKWFQAAKDADGVDEANAMTLSTSSNNGMPRGRIVLLKEYGKDGFVFYSNYGSEKGLAIAENNQVSISFFWPVLERQIIIQGTAERVSKDHSEAYFSKRPRKSQLGALVSNQSDPITNREALEEKLQKLEEQWEGKEVPMPENWGGYAIIPKTFEFWQGRRSRLHDRIQYQCKDDQWVINRLQP